MCDFDSYHYYCYCRWNNVGGDDDVDHHHGDCCGIEKRTKKKRNGAGEDDCYDRDNDDDDDVDGEGWYVAGALEDGDDGDSQNVHLERGR